MSHSPVFSSPPSQYWISPAEDRPDFILRLVRQIEDPSETPGYDHISGYSFINHIHIPFSKTDPQVALDAMDDDKALDRMVGIYYHRHHVFLAREEIPMLYRDWSLVWMAVYSKKERDEKGWGLRKRLNWALRVAFNPFAKPVIYVEDLRRGRYNSTLGHRWYWGVKDMVRPLFPWKTEEHGQGPLKLREGAEFLVRRREERKGSW